MKNIVSLFLIGIVIILASCSNNSALYPKETYELNIQNPSDITFNKAKGGYFISTNDGVVISLDTSFNIQRKTFVENTDFGSIIYEKSSILLSDKNTNRFYRVILPGYKVINSKFRIMGISAKDQSKVIGMTYDECKDNWMIIQDTEPLQVNYYDGDFHFIDRLRLKNVNGASSCDSYQGYLYFLTDSSMVYKVNSGDLKTVQSWMLDVEDPKGICFDDNGNIIVLAGSEGKVFVFGKEQFAL